MIKLISLTPDAEKHIAYCARVSSPNQDNPDYAGLLKYCIKHGHWSIFEQAHATVEIQTTRAIAAQILRHRSFNFQEHSQRYSEAMTCSILPARRQDTKNRQSSHDDLPEHTKDWFENAQREVWTLASNYYDNALRQGIAKECARFLLPLSTDTRMYMTGNIRSWIHYCMLRCGEDTQLEHRQIALDILQVLKDNLPVVGTLLQELIDEKTT